MFSPGQTKVQLYALYTKSLSEENPPTVPPTRPQRASSLLSKRARLASFNMEAETASGSTSVFSPAAAPALATAPAAVIPAPQPNSAGLAVLSPLLSQANLAPQTRSQAPTFAHTFVPPVQAHLLPTSDLLSLAHSSQNPAPVLPSPTSFLTISGAPPSVRLPPQSGPALVSCLLPPYISSSTSFFPSTSTEPSMRLPPQTVPASFFPLSAFLPLTLLQPVLHPILCQL